MNPSAAGRTVRLLFQPLAGSERVLAIIQNAERFFCLNLSSGRENLKSPADSGGRRRPISSKSVCRANLPAVHPASGFRKTAQKIPPRQMPGRDCSVSKKPFRHAAASFSALKSAEKLMIQNERHPSWVSFVTIFLPVAHIFEFIGSLKSCLFRERIKLCTAQRKVTPRYGTSNPAVPPE